MIQCTQCKTDLLTTFKVNAVEFIANVAQPISKMIGPFKQLPIPSSTSLCSPPH